MMEDLTIVLVVIFTHQRNRMVMCITLQGEVLNDAFYQNIAEEKSFPQKKPIVFQRVFWDEVDGLLERVLKLAELLRVNRSVDHEQEDRLRRGRLASRGRNDILDCREVLHELGRQLLLGDMLGVVLREVVLVAA